MAFLFGGARPANKDSLKDYQRKITMSVRGMEREIRRQDVQEAKLQRELAKCAQENKIDLATSKAREMVRMRSHRTRLYTMKEHMTGLAQQLQTVQSSTKIQETIATTALMLQGLNARFDAPAVARMLAEFEKQTTLITSKQEIVEDTLDSAFEVDGETDATDEAVLDVLQGVGLDLRGKLGDAREGLKQETDAEGLEERLHRLRH
jgi:division protein CdvB (Snf7/Vps24/ESCRT-III family)